jgi:hypothetical protein
VSLQDYALSPEFCEAGDKLLMSSTEYASSVEFQTQKIYQRLYSDWQEDSLGQIKKWFLSWEYHDIPEGTLELWRTLYEAHMKKELAKEEHQTYLGEIRSLDLSHSLSLSLSLLLSHTLSLSVSASLSLCLSLSASLSLPLSLCLSLSVSLSLSL